MTFRCPDDLLSLVDSFGQEHFPTNNASGCDSSKTLIVILEAGLNSLSDGTAQSKTDEIQVLQQVLQEAIAQEVKLSVRQELAEVRQSLDQRIVHLEQEQTRYNLELVSSKLELLCQCLGKIESAIARSGSGSAPAVLEIAVQPKDDLYNPVKS